MICVIRDAVERGVTVFDTAEACGPLTMTSLRNSSRGEGQAVGLRSRIPKPFAARTLCTRCGTAERVTPLECSNDNGPRPRRGIRDRVGLLRSCGDGPHREVRRGSRFAYKDAARRCFASRRRDQSEHCVCRSHPSMGGAERHSVPRSSPSPCSSRTSRSSSQSPPPPILITRRNIGAVTVDQCHRSSGC